MTKYVGIYNFAHKFKRLLFAARDIVADRCACL